MLSKQLVGLITVQAVWLQPREFAVKVSLLLLLGTLGKGKLILMFCLYVHIQFKTAQERTCLEMLTVPFLWIKLGELPHHPETGELGKLFPRCCEETAWLSL